jgi:hypothetical protein
VITRFARQILFASLIACHAAVMLCGPCLHTLPGSTHQMGAGAATKSHGPEDSAPSRRDASDDCLICHFVAQGQLCAAIRSELAIQPAIEFVVPCLLAARPSAQPLPSSPRAPPADAII